LAEFALGPFRRCACSETLRAPGATDRAIQRSASACDDEGDRSSREVEVRLCSGGPGGGDDRGGVDRALRLDIAASAGARLAANGACVDEQPQRLVEM